jgi:protein-tyrosine phosphatase
MKISVLFVCLGNICRSPTAEAVFRKIVDEEISKNNLPFDIVIDSAGTGDWHIGRSPDSRAQSAGKQRGFDLSPLKGRQVSRDDFSTFDYVLAMDDQNLKDLQKIASGSQFKGHLGLFLEFSTMPEREVPDPYYGGASGFDHVLDLVEDASRGLLTHILKNISESQ